MRPMRLYGTSVLSQDRFRSRPVPLTIGIIGSNREGYLFKSLDNHLLLHVVFIFSNTTFGLVCIKYETLIKTTRMSGEVKTARPFLSLENDCGHHSNNPGLTLHTYL